MQDIFDYFLTEKKLRYPIASFLSKKLEKYDDIRDGFLEWLKRRDFAGLTKPEVCGYTPEKVHNICPALDAAGVFNLLVTFRDNPNSASLFEANGFADKDFIEGV